MTRGAGALGRVVDVLPALLVLVAAVATWEVTVRALDVAPYLVPAPSRIWDAFLETRSLLPGHTRTTLLEAGLGLIGACLLAATSAALLASSGVFRRAFYPLIVISQTIPMVVLAPLVGVWFGYGITPKILFVALICYFPIVVSTTDALLRADRDLADLARSLGAGRWQVLRTILVPSAVPGFFAGLKISATYAVLGAVIAEWMGTSSGLGLFITRAQTAFRVDRVFVAVILIAIVSILLFAAVHLLARLAMPWQRVGGDPERGHA